MARSLHVHQRRERMLGGEAVQGTESTVTGALVFICATCRATWRILPLFIAHCLWRSLPGRREADAEAFAQVPALPPTLPRGPPVALAGESTGLLLAQLLAVSGEPRLRSVAQRCALVRSRLEFVERFADEFAPAPGAWLAHRRTCAP